MRSKPNRERLDHSHVTNMLYTQAALNTLSGHLPSSYEFSKEGDDTEWRRKNFERKLRFERFFL